MKFLTCTTLTTLLLLGLSVTAYAAPNPQKEALDLPEMLAVPGTAFPESATLPSYMLNNPVPLSGAEQDSLNMANQWAARYAKPMLMGNDKLVWMYGVSRPTIIGAPMQVCDMELQPGEQINEVLVGDNVRWVVELGKAGGDSGRAEHVFIKPLDVGLDTTAVITTDRRVYHVRLVSRESGHTPYVGFLYPEDQFQKHGSLTARRNASPQTPGVSTVSTSGSADLSSLSFAYAIKGDAKWRPEQVYDDGKKMFLRLPAQVSTMPILLAKDGSSKDLLVNYRTQGSTFVVDGVFEHVVLLLGTGSKQDKVDVRRGK